MQISNLQGRIPRPNLLGAIVVKACAVDVDDALEAQRVDLAFLLSLVEQPRGVAESLTRQDLRRLRRRAELLDPRHPAWFQVDRPEVGQRALRVLLA